jgi:hypothetical protein
MNNDSKGGLLVVIDQLLTFSGIGIDNGIMLKLHICLMSLM